MQQTWPPPLSQKSQAQATQVWGDPTTSGTKKIHDQKFAIRSPPHAGGRFVKSDQENESSEASQEESEHQNSSDEEVSFCVLYK